MPVDRNINIIPVYEARGRKISTILESTSPRPRFLESASDVPSKGQPFSFDLKVGRKTFLILDPYGNEVLPHAMEERLVRASRGSYTIGIDRTTGFVYKFYFGRYSDGRNFAIQDLLEYSDCMSFQVPSSQMSELDSLRETDCPFKLSLRTDVLLRFCDQEIGYDDLRKGLLVRLNFRPKQMELSSYGHRFVDDWVTDEVPQKVVNFR